MAATRFFAPALFATLGVLLMTKWLDFNDEKLLWPQRISSYFIGKTPATNDDFHRVGAVWECFVRARRSLLIIITNVVLQCFSTLSYCYYWEETLK